MAFFDINGLAYRPDGAEEDILRGIDLKISEGEFVALIGANGSGKTTLARHLNALLLPGRGRVLVDGLDTHEHAHLPRIRSWVGMVFQSPEEQIVANTIEEDVAFGLENLALPPVEIRTRVTQSLDAVGLAGLRLRPPHQLSAGQVQRVALAGILAMCPRAVILDEPSAHLDPLGRMDFYKMIEALHRQGITILWITHYMEEAAQAERVIVLHAGRIHLDGTPATVFSDEHVLKAVGLEIPPAARLAALLRPSMPGLPVSLITGEELLCSLPDFSGPMAAPAVSITAPANNPPLIAVDELSYTYLKGTPFASQALDRVSYHVGKHTSHGLVGATGSGKSTLLQHLNGLNRPQSGSVRVGPFDLADAKIALKTVCQYVGLAFQLPELYFFEQFVGDEIAFGPRQMEVNDLAGRVRWAMQQVGLDFESFKDRLVYTLSGGEKRKVALASVLALMPQILVLDEPLAGLDPGSRSEMMARLDQWRKTGSAMVVSSHSMGDLVEMVEQVTVLEHGHDVISGDTSVVFSQEEALRKAGMQIPLTAQVALRLRQKGWPLPDGLVQPDRLAEQVSRIVQGRAV